MPISQKDWREPKSNKINEVRHLRKVKELSLDRLVELIEDNIPDPRRPGGNIRHKLVDLYVIILLGIICGCETWIDSWPWSRGRLP